MERDFKLEIIVSHVFFENQFLSIDISFLFGCRNATKLVLITSENSLIFEIIIFLPKRFLLLMTEPLVSINGNLKRI